MNPSLNSIKPGDCFRLGVHVVMCGDSRDKSAMTNLLAGQKIKAVITDPPYGVALASNSLKPILKNKLIENDHLQSDAEYERFSLDWIEAIKPHLEKKNVFYIFNSDKMVFALRNAMLAGGLKFAQLLIWVKTHAVVGRLDYAPQHELIAYGWHGTHEFLKSKDKSVIIFPKPNKSPFHPSTKPIGLIRQLVLNSTRIGDVVFDGFLGSGTALLACEETKRVCVGVEIDPEYVRTAILRWEKLTGLSAEKI